MAVKAKSIICMFLDACPRGLHDFEDALIELSMCRAFPAAAGPLQTERALGRYEIPTSLAGEATRALHHIYTYTHAPYRYTDSSFACAYTCTNTCTCAETYTYTYIYI